MSYRFVSIKCNNCNHVISRSLVLRQRTLSICQNWPARTGPIIRRIPPLIKTIQPDQLIPQWYTEVAGFDKILKFHFKITSSVCPPASSDFLKALYDCVRWSSIIFIYATENSTWRELGKFKMWFSCEQVKRDSAGHSSPWLKSNYRSLPHGRFWMWRWRMDTSHEDGRQQGKHLSVIYL